jgi:hypothetical protein
MRVPVKSEADAFRLTFGVVAVIAAVVALGALTDPLVGVALLVGIAVGAVGWQMATRDPDRAMLRDVRADAEPETDERHRILVIANQTVAGDELRRKIVEHAGSRPLVRVFAPVLPTRAHYITSDIDRELADAQQRLDVMLGWLREKGIEATGRVGDLTPRQAIEDELRAFAADELILSTHPAARSHWLESGLLEQAREELDIPVAHVVVDLERQAAASSGASSPT